MNEQPQPGGTNAINAAGGSRPTGARRSGEKGGGTQNESSQDAEASFEETRHASPSVAKQFARDEADADTAARSPHGAGEPRYHQIHADPRRTPGDRIEEAK